MRVNPPSRSELLRLVQHAEARLRFIIDMLPEHSKIARWRLGQLANRLARVLAREPSSSFGDD